MARVRQSPAWTMEGSLAIRRVDGLAKAAAAARGGQKPDGRCEGGRGLLFQISELGCVMACRKDRDSNWYSSGKNIDFVGRAYPTKGRG